MDNTSNIADIIINTINTIFQTLFSSIDNSLYNILDNIVFINEDILENKYFENILGTSATNGILLIANSLIFGFLIYYSARFFLSHMSFSQIENPHQFLFKIIFFSICMNFSYFIIKQLLIINSTITLSIKSIGEGLLHKKISFSYLITEINSTISLSTTSLNVFSVDGLVKSTLSISLLSLILSYSLRYIIVKIFILLTPFSILSLSLESSSWFFKSWLKNLFSLLFIQIIVSLVLILLLSMNYSSGNILNKFLYVGAIYFLIRVNSFVKDFVGGISTTISQSVTNWR